MIKKYNAIEVDKIGKRFVLGETASYEMLRESIADMPKKLFLRQTQKRNKNIFWALKNVTFSVKKGEVLGLIGRNGSGKSTLLKILAQILAPTTGGALIHGRVASILEVGTGFHPELTGRENIYLNGAILGMKNSEIKSKYKKIVEFAEVEDFLDTPIKKYSSGMQVRLAFSVASHLDAEVLLIDEVLAVGDASFQKKSLQKMKSLTKDEGRTVIFVSHSMPSVDTLCSKALLLDRGRIKLFGDTKSVVSNYLTGIEGQETDILGRSKPGGKNRGIEITSFYMLDENKRKISLPRTGEKCYFVFEYKSGKEKHLKNVDFGFSVRTIFDQPLFLNYTSYSDQTITRVANKGSFVFEFPKFPLAAGIYKIGYRLTVNDEEVDSLDDASTLRVEDGDFYGTGIPVSQNHSPMYIDGKWIIK